MKITSTDQSSSITLDPSLIVTNLPSTHSITINNIDIPQRLEKIEKLLGIISDPTPEQLEQHRALKDAYNKYKLIEKLLLGEGTSET